ncbi:hypothetical protein Tco_0763321 [Tanacetum coccineum]
MHTRASNSELVEPLPEPEGTLNRRLRRQNRRVSLKRRNERPERIVFPPYLDINRFRHFLDILQNYDQKDGEPMWAVDRVVALTLGSAITILETANEFAIKGNHLNLVKGNQFDGRIKTDPHKHIHGFLEICDMFKYKDIENEYVRLMMFPLSLTVKQKIVWTNSMKKPSKHKINLELPLLADWLYMKETLRIYHDHNLSKGNIIQTFITALTKLPKKLSMP